MPTVLLSDADCPDEMVVAGTLLQRNGELPDAVLYIESGRVALGRCGEGSAGRTLQLQVGTVEGPAWLETSAAILNIPNAVDAVAVTNVCLRRVPLCWFRASTESSTQMLQTLIRDTSTKHYQLTELALGRRSRDAQARCAVWLLNQAEVDAAGGRSVRLQQDKRAVAVELGIVPETLSRILKQMRHLHFISGSGRQVKLLDLQGLRRLADGTPSRRP